MTAPVGVVMRRAAELAARRHDPRRAERQAQREAYPTVREMVAERSKPLSPDPLEQLVCLLADLPNHLQQKPAEDFRPEALPDRLQRIGG